MKYNEFFNKLENKSDKEKIEIIAKEKFMFDNMEKFFNEGKKINIEVTILIILFIKKDEGVDFLRKKGVFRIFDKIDNGLCIIKRIEKIKLLKDELAIDTTYFEQKLNFKSILRDILKKKESVVAQYSKYGSRAIIDLLSFCSYQILNRNEDVAGLKKNKNLDSFENYNYIDCCDAVSLMISFLIKNERIKQPCLNYCFKELNIEKDLLFFMKVNNLIAYEILFDYLPFNMFVDGKKISFKCQDKDLWKSVEWSYILGNMSKNNNEIYNKDIEFVGISELFDINKIDINGLFNVKLKDDFGYKRYVFEISQAMQLLFQKIKFFKEEIKLLNLLSNELVIPFQDILNLKISNEIELIDVLNFKKIFLLWDEKIKQLEFSNNELFYNSVAQFIEKDKFVSLFELLLPKEKILEMVDMFDYNRSDVKDILYYPFIVIEDKVVFSPMICAASFMERNSISIAKKLSATDITYKIINNRKEYIEPFIENICKENNIKYKIGNMEFSYNKQESDIDAIIYDDKTLIVIECKSPTSSANFHELRSIFEYLKKGAKQLSLSTTALNDSKFYNEKMTKWGIDNKKRNVYSFICNAQREFNGYKLNGYPIRSVKELNNYLSNGSMILLNEEYRIRHKEDVIEAIIDFISDDSYIADVFNNMENYFSIFHIGKYRIDLEGFAINLLEYKNSLTKYKIK